jgi:hypothetical protein
MFFVIFEHSNKKKYKKNNILFFFLFLKEEIYYKIVNNISEIKKYLSQFIHLMKKRKLFLFCYKIFLYFIILFYT